MNPEQAVHITGANEYTGGLYAQYTEAAVALGWAPMSANAQSAPEYGLQMQRFYPDHPGQKPSEQIKLQLETIAGHTAADRPALIVPSSLIYAYGNRLSLTTAVAIGTAFSAKQPVIFGERLSPRPSKGPNGVRLPPAPITDAMIEKIFSVAVPVALGRLILETFQHYQSLVLPPSRLRQGGHAYLVSLEQFVPPQLSEEQATILQAARLALEVATDAGYAGVLETQVTSKTEIKTRAPDTAYAITPALSAGITVPPSIGGTSRSGVPNQPTTDYDGYTHAPKTGSLGDARLLLRYDQTTQGAIRRAEDRKQQLRDGLNLGEKSDLLIRTVDGRQIVMRVVSFENGIQVSHDNDGNPHAMDFGMLMLQTVVNGHVMTVLQPTRAMEFPYKAFEESEASNFEKTAGECAVEALKKVYAAMHDGATIELDAQNIHTILYGLPKGIVDLRLQSFVEALDEALLRLTDPHIRQTRREQALKRGEHRPTGRIIFDPIYAEKGEAVRQVQVKYWATETEVQDLLSQLHTEGYTESESIIEEDTVWVTPDQTFPLPEGALTYRIRKTIHGDGKTEYTATIKRVSEEDELNKSAWSVSLADETAAITQVVEWQELYGCTRPVRVYKTRQVVELPSTVPGRPTDGLWLRIDRPFTREGGVATRMSDKVYLELERRSTVISPDIIKRQLHAAVQSLGFTPDRIVTKGFDTLEQLGEI